MNWRGLDSQAAKRYDTMGTLGEFFESWNLKVLKKSWFTIKVHVITYINIRKSVWSDYELSNLCSNI